MAVTKRIRYEVLRRDGSTCRYCGGQSPDVQLTIDHVVPTALGGSDDPSNLVAACRDCNAGKTSTSPSDPLVAQVDADAVRWAAAMKAAADAYNLRREEAQEQYQALEEVWETQNAYHRFGRLRLPSDWTDSVDQWLKAGVPLALIGEAMEIAVRNRKVPPSEVWRYTCGVVWRRLTELQEAAKACLPAGEMQERYCGHCYGCIEYMRSTDPDAEPCCYTYGDREPDEDPDECEICGGQECVPGQARSAALIEGYEAGCQVVHTRWWNSLERVQSDALSSVVDRVYGWPC